MMQESLAESLRILRARRGLTLTQAAGRAGVTRDTLSDLERGKRHAYMPTLAKIAKGYDVPVEDLLEEPVPLAEAPKETGQPWGREAEGLKTQQLRQWAERFRAIAERLSARIEQAGPEDLEILVHESVFLVNGAKGMKRRSLDPLAEGGSQAVRDAAAEVEQAVGALDYVLLYTLNDKVERHNAAVADGGDLVDMDEARKLRAVG